MLMTGDIRRGSVGTSNPVSDLIEELQYTLGEGPCLDAYHDNQPVLEPNLVEPVVPRWLAFSGPAIDAGVRAVFGFPLQAGAIRIGALNLYRDRSGPLTPEQHDDALVLAGVTTETVLALQADAPPGELAEALEAHAEFQFAVHNAAGMVSVQLGVSIPEAILRLRAYAFANNRPLTAVAKDVVERRLELSD